MKYINVAATTLALAMHVQGQNLPPDFTQTPSCAFQPLLDAVAASGCANTDVACWCADADWKSTFQSEVESSCTDADDLADAYRIIEETCSLNGVTVDFNSGSGETSSSIVASPTSTTLPPASSTPESPSSSATPLSTSITETLASDALVPSTAILSSSPSSSNEPSTFATNYNLESTVSSASSAATATSASMSTYQPTSASSPLTSVSTSSAGPVTAGAGRCAARLWAH